MNEIKQFRLDGGNASGLPRVPPQPPETLDCDEPRQYRHLYFQDEAGKFRAGVWGCSAFATKLIPQKSHEIVLVADGELTIADAEGRETVYGVGDCFVIPAGMKRRWIHREMTTVYFVSYEDGAYRGDQRVMSIDPRTELAPSKPPAAELLLSPPPTTRLSLAYENPDKSWSAGVWDATPYHRKQIPFPRYEFMHLLDGEVSFTHARGDIKRFAKGDTFLVPPGVFADWHNPTYIRKFFCVFRQPA